MKKLAIIGASYLQDPLIWKAKSMGLETHVFAWAANDVGEKSADYFYPISIIEKEQILRKCTEIGIDGICSIASDLASQTVDFVADRLNLSGNSLECAWLSTNKYFMRKAFEKHGDPSPKSYLVENKDAQQTIPLQYPVIVKPVDRSGSRGITKLESEQGFKAAIEAALEQGFDKKVLVEEFLTGQEYSVECISWKGRHYFLALTKKYTSGAPHYIERAHLEPAVVTDKVLEKVKRIVFHALDSLKITDGASHTELKIADDGDIKLIEIGSRMGGDYIGSSLVTLSTGIDFVRAVIQIAIGEEPQLSPVCKPRAAAVRFVFSEEDIEVLHQIKAEHPEYIVFESIREIDVTSVPVVTDSSNRFGAYLLSAPDSADLEKYLPAELEG